MNISTNKILILLLLVTVNQISGQKLYPENYIQFVQDENDAFCTRINLIRSAKKEILISYYKFKDDKPGSLILDELIQIKKSRPEIVIRLIVDAFTQGLSPEIIYFLGTKGIKVKEFHPLPKLWLPNSHKNASDFFFSIKNFNKRMHDKLLIIDGQRILLGGRNIEESYFGLAKTNFYDREIIIQNKKAAAEASKYFYKIWNSGHVKSICPAIDYPKKKSYFKKVQQFKEYIETGLSQEQTQYNCDLTDQNRSITKYRLSDITFINSYCDKSGDLNPQKLSNIYFDLINNCKEEIIIETPYLVCPESFIQNLGKLRKKGIRIVFITNSFCTTDVSVAAAAYDIKKDELLKMGIEIYEYKGPGYLHSKCTVVDGKKGIVGSLNLDPRSISTNTETLVVFEGDEAVQHLLDLLENDMQKSSKIEWQNDNIEGQCLNCNRGLFDTVLYILFLSLANWNWVYNLL